MYINWSILVPAPGDVLIPTYGNYGGPLYSDGEILSDPNQPVDYSSPAVDVLDALFLAHDKAYDSTDPLVRATGDVALLEGIIQISQGDLDPEASLYAGFAAFFAIEQITVANNHPELLSPDLLSLGLSVAVQDIEFGLANLQPVDWIGIQAWLQEAGGLDPIAGLIEQASAWLGELEGVPPSVGIALTIAEHRLDAGILQLSGIEQWGAPLLGADLFGGDDVFDFSGFSGSGPELPVVIVASTGPEAISDAPALDPLLAALAHVATETSIVTAQDDLLLV